jgi:phosphoribosylformylglycinamidine (FGAM) synthase-like enzyme
MQDMGAAGITCSTSEMSAKSGAVCGSTSTKCRQRQANMKDWEILLSESQERMLIVCKPGREAEIQAVFDKWDLPCEQIGKPPPADAWSTFTTEQKVADVPAETSCWAAAPRCMCANNKRPDYLDRIEKFDLQQIARTG